MRTCGESIGQNSKKAVRTITYSNYIAHSEPLLKELNLLKVKDLFELKILKFLFKLYHNTLPPYFNSYRSYLEKNVTPYTLRPHPLPVPRVSHVFEEAGILYKLVLTKNKPAASDEVISFRTYDQSYSQIGFNQYVIKKMVDSLCIKSLSHLWPCIVYCCMLANGDVLIVCNFC